MRRDVKDFRVVGKFAVEHLNGFNRRAPLIEVDGAAHRGYPCLELELFVGGLRRFLQELQRFLAFAVLRQRETLLCSDLRLNT